MVPHPFLGLAPVAILLLLAVGSAAGDAPPAGDVHFPGSRIILNNATWGAAVNSWAKKPAAQAWHLCYSSFTDTPNTPATFHKQCDPHNNAMVFARNSIGRVFGGYAAKPWNYTACCAVSENKCYPNGGGCYDRSAASDFLFRLQPGKAERFLPIGGTDNDWYQCSHAASNYWPAWGDLDLYMGYDGPPGHNGYCQQGHTYAGSLDEACGGEGNWGPTDLEVWFL